MGFFARNAHKSPNQTSLRLLTISYRNKSKVRLHHYPHLIMLLSKTRFRSDCSRVVSQVSILFNTFLLISQITFFIRCTAHRKNLDGKDDVCPCHHTHTKVLLETFSSKVLWKEYGIVDDILVSSWLIFNMPFN